MRASTQARRAPKTCAVLLAAGEGVRSGGRKQFRRAHGRSLLVHAAVGLLRVREIRGLVVVVPVDRVEPTERDLEQAALPCWQRVVAGGATRHLSSRAGIDALPDSCEWVLVHDAARPFASPELIRRVLRAARRAGAAVPALDVHDSILLLEAGNAAQASRYLPRARLRAVQTPQAFARDRLVDCFARARRHDFTDDASVVRRYGYEVEVVGGEDANRKITTPEQLRTALRELARREKTKHGED